MTNRTEKILAMFSELNGTKFVGITEYNSVKSGEICDHLINANFSYGNAVNKSIAILENLNDNDFTAIAEKYNVTNISGEKYGSNKPAKEFLETGKISKVGTKAHENTLKGVKETKTIATIVSEMVKSFIDNQNEETRSAQSKAQSDAYEPVTKGVKRNVESGNLHIWAMAISKHNFKKYGTFPESNPGIETAQKNAIQSYCKNVLNSQLPTTKYRNFVITDNQLSEINITGETITFIK